MEAYYLLCGHVQVSRPVLAEIVVLVVVVAQRSDIVGERVYPHVNNVSGVEIHRDSPFEAGSGNAQILKSGLDEVVYHLVNASLRLEVVGLGEELLNFVCIIGQAQEVSLLVGVDDVSAAVGTLAVHKLALGPEALAGGAVLAGVLALVDIALVVEGLEYLLHRGNMIVVSGADKSVVAYPHGFPEALEVRNDLVNVLLRGYALFLCLQLYLLTMLVGSCQEHYVIALHSLESCDGITRYGRIAVTDMRISRRIVDRGGDVIFSLTAITHCYYYLFFYL